MSSSANQVVETTENYYDSEDADNFYHQVWGGEDIHIGIYQSVDEEIKTASQRTVSTMAEKLNLAGHETILDIGAGYGGAARYLARTYGVKVTCLNLSEVENEKNLQKNQAAGLADKIEVVKANFEQVPFEDESFDIVWSEDAILHSANKEQVFREVNRVLKPGGQFIFTDPMQDDRTPSSELTAVLARIHLDSMGSIRLYRELAGELGMKEVSVDDLTENLTRHYSRVSSELERNRGRLKNISDSYIDNMLNGLQHWVDAGKKGKLSWGILHFTK